MSASPLLRCKYSARASISMAVRFARWRQQAHKRTCISFREPRNRSCGCLLPHHYPLADPRAERMDINNWEADARSGNQETNYAAESVSIYRRKRQFALYPNKPFFVVLCQLFALRERKAPLPPFLFPNKMSRRTSAWLASTKRKNRTRSR